MSVPDATILIVDNEERNRRLLEAMLRPAGYLTQTADSGEAALRQVALHAPDLILLDVMMPGMNGYEVAARLKSEPATANIPIIMVTAQIDRDARLAGLKAGAEDFLTKPVERAELWLRVRNLLRLKAYADLLQNQSRLLELEVRSRTAELQRFRTAMDASADGIMLVSRSSLLFLEVNATARTMFGYSAAEFLALGPTQLGAGEQPAEDYDGLIAGHPVNALIEVRLRRKDGTLFPAEVHRQALQSGT